MDKIDKLMNLIADDLQVNAMPFEQYCYEVKSTHQIIRKHITEQLLAQYIKSDLANAYHGGWRRSKKYAKETNFHGLNRKEIKKYFNKWFKEHHE